MFHCHFPKFCMLKISAFLDDRYHRGVPNVHLCRMKWFLYNIYVDEIPKRVHNELANLVIRLKQFCIMTAAEEKWINWSETVHYAQLMSHIKRVIIQRKFLNLPVDILQDMFDHVVNDFTISQNQGA